MIRAVAYLGMGWVLIASVGALADVLSLSVMLPATSVIVLTHIAFERKTPLPAGLAVAIGLGYLEDLYQGAPVGVLCLSHAVAYLAFQWAASRLHLGGWISHMLASAVGVVLVDGVTVIILLVLADRFGVRREALWGSVPELRWHWLATCLAAPPQWWVFDRMLIALRIEEPPPPPGPWGSGS